MTFLTLPAAKADAHPARIALDLLAGVRREWTLLLARRSMKRLDDWVLHDLGVARGDIDRAVRHGRRAMKTPIA